MPLFNSNYDFNVLIRKFRLKLYPFMRSLRVSRYYTIIIFKSFFIYISYIYK